MKVAQKDMRTNKNSYAIEPKGASHVMKLHHIGIASENLETAIQHHKMLFEVHPITDIVEDPVHKVSAVLLSGPDGGVPIELVAPLAKDSPVSRLMKRGIRLYHLCYLAKDIEKTLEEARRQSSLVISKPAPARLYGGRRIAFVYTADGYVVEFLEEEK